MTNLIVPPRKFKNQCVFIFNNSVFLDRYAYVITNDDDLNNLPVPDVIRDEIKKGVSGELLETNDIATLKDTLDKFDLANLSEFIGHELYMANNNKADDKVIGKLKEIITKLELHDNAWLYCYYFGIDDDMRQTIINSKNGSSAYKWCCHIQHENVMRDIILKSGDIWSIAGYSLLIECKDPDIEDMILDDDNVSTEVIDFYVSRKQDLEFKKEMEEMQNQ